MIKLDIRCVAAPCEHAYADFAIAEGTRRRSPGVGGTRRQCSRGLENVIWFFRGGRLLVVFGPIAFAYNLKHKLSILLTFLLVSCS